ncbi:NAD(P)H-dependent oxidoreductase [Streptomyces aurantiacus]|uniref:Putative NAD(P)H-dependent FMN reductase C4B3.06c n=1 Tax=Streptomyces aurantiacus JA 4570 TaxID=1286094 RepID=S3ZYF2_9ACTN|nr:NAD(P)H-dependent oxidoreductase [Streptomyces aurantiacus]EPH43460.1 putative NAD(P)H-dependent FMN reductase C4B3.06c [Streptomyces aurantiacus JA 4570]
MNTTTTAQTVSVSPSPAAALTATAEAPVKVAVIVGSNREGRFGPVVAEWLLRRVRGHEGFEADVVDLAEVDLPTSLSYRPSADVVAELAKVSPKLAEADAFIVLTPEYNHSFPASLKNVIDWHRDEWQAKPVALVSYGGISGGLRAVEHLRQVFAELHMVTVRDTVSFHNAGALFDGEGNHRDPSVADAAAKGMLDQLQWWAWALRGAKKVRAYGS